MWIIFSGFTTAIFRKVELIIEKQKDLNNNDKT